jgi:hypothetical protein
VACKRPPQLRTVQWRRERGSQQANDPTRFAHQVASFAKPLGAGGVQPDYPGGCIQSPPAHLPKVAVSRTLGTEDGRRQHAPPEAADHSDRTSTCSRPQSTNWRSQVRAELELAAGVVANLGRIAH